jgi:gliding motility-associated-like protein
MNVNIRIIYIFLLLTFLVGNGFNNISAQCNFSQGPIGELCTSANFICGSDLNGFIGRLPDTLSADQPWQGLCGSEGNADNILWFSFTACSSTVTLRIIPTNCSVTSTGYTGIQAGFFRDCDKEESVACSDHTNNNGLIMPFILSYTGFTPGEPVFLFVDGYAGSVCDFTIEVLEGVDLNVVTPPNASTLDEGFITGPNQLACQDLNTPQRYNLTPPQCDIALNITCGQSPNNIADSICYVWNISPNVGRYFVSADSVGKYTDIAFTEPGTYTISVQEYFHPFYGGSCANASCGEINTWTVTVTSPDTITNNSLFICPGNTFEFCGMTIDTDTTIICSLDPCNVIIQPFQIGTSNVNQMGTQYICDGSSYSFQGVNYTSAGNYSIVDINDCSLVHTFRVEIANIDANIVAPITELDCKNTTINLKSTISTNGVFGVVYEWRNSLGQQISSSEDLVVSAPDIYTLIASLNLPSGKCSSTIQIDIPQDIKVPEVTAFKPVLKCRLPNDAPPILTLITNDPLQSATWITPTGTSNQGMNIIVDSINVSTGLPYLFTAIGQNGCILDTSFVIEYNYQLADVKLTGENITCYKPKVELFLTSSLAWDSIRWERVDPNANIFYDSNNKLILDNVDTEGLFRANVMASSSKCWSFGEMRVFDNKIRPRASVDADIVWNCNTQSLTVTPEVSLGNEFQYFWGTSTGTILSDQRSPDLVIGNPGTYLLNVFNSDNGCQTNDTLVVPREQNVPTEILLTADDVICFGENNGRITIANVNGGFEPYSYFLNDQPLNDTNITSLVPGDYVVQVRDKFDCVHEVQLSISEPPLVELNTPSEIDITFDENISLFFSSNYPDDEIVQVTWSNSAGEIISEDFEFEYSSTFADIIKVEVVTENGCIAESRIKINVDNELDLYLPNIFSPNGDGNNDRFVIYKNKIPANIDRLSIYDRFGNMVYVQNNFDFEDNPIGWDGTYHNAPVVTGVYIYVIEYTDFRGEKNIVKKDLTLVR